MSAQKGTDLSLVAITDQGAPYGVVVSASGGMFLPSVFYNVKGHPDAGSSALRIFSFTLGANNNPVGSPATFDLFSAGIDTATPLVNNLWITEISTAQPFIDLPAGGQIGGQMAAFQVNGIPGDTFDIYGQIIFVRVG